MNRKNHGRKLLDSQRSGPSSHQRAAVRWRVTFPSAALGITQALRSKYQTTRGGPKERQPDGCQPQRADGSNQHSRSVVAGSCLLTTRKAPQSGSGKTSVGSAERANGVIGLPSESGTFLSWASHQDMINAT